MLEVERDPQEPSEELDELAAKLYDKVIPRLLRPLTALGSAKPVAIHADLWYGNCYTDEATGKPLVLDRYLRVLCAQQMLGPRPRARCHPVPLLTFHRRDWYLESAEISVWRAV